MTSPRGYDAGTAFLQVIPSFRGVQKAIEREVRGIERALGQHSGKEFKRAFEENSGDAVDRVLGTNSARRTGNKAGDEAGKAYAGAFSGHLKKALGDAQREVRASIKLTDDKDVERRLRGISNEINKINKAKIGIDMDAGAALAKVEAIRAAIQEVQRAAQRVDLRVNSATMQASLERAEKQIRELSNINIEIKPELNMGNFERTLKARIKAATANLPELKFNANTTPAENKLQTLRARMIALGDKTIGVDINASEALKEMEALRRALAVLATDTEIDVKVRTDAAAAAKDLLQIRALAELVDKTRVDIKVDIDVDRPIRGLTRLRRSMNQAGHSGEDSANAFRLFNFRVLGVALILPLVAPLAIAAAGGIALLGAAALGVIAGIGALVFAFSGLGDALKALRKADEDGSKKEFKTAKAAATAARSVRDAEQKLTEARQNSGRAAEQAARQVADAVGQQEDAERDLVRAQEDVVRAQEAVNDAREQARERIEDLQLSIRGGVLAERDAILDLREAEQELRDTTKTGDDRERLVINLEQARLRVDQLRESNADMAAEQAEFNRTGVEGSEEVQSAQEGVAAAQEGVRAAMERVADAGQAIAEAQSAAADASVEDSKRVADAQQDLTDAQIAYSEAVFAGTRAGSQAFADLEIAMAKLGPAGQHFTYFIDTMRDDMRGFRDDIQKGLFPGLEDAILRIVTVNGPLIEEFMTRMGIAWGDMFRNFGILMTSDPWQEIWASFAHYAPIYMHQFGTIGMNMLTFFGELFRGLGPYTQRFNNAIIGITDNMARWMAEWTRSSSFSQTMEWMFRVGAQVWETLLAVGEAIWDIIVALEPLGSLLLDALQNISEWLSAMDPKTLGTIATAFIGLVVSIQLAAGAMSLLRGGLSVTGRLITGIVLAASLLVTGLIALYNSSEDWRNIIDDLLGLVGDLGSVIGAVLAPVLELITDLFWGLSGLMADNTIAAGALLVAILAWLAWGKVSLAILGIRLALLSLPAAFAAVRAAAVVAGTSFTGFGIVAGRAITGLRTAATRFVGFLGGPWMVALLALGAMFAFISSDIRDATEQEEKWADALRKGGAAAVDVEATYRQQRENRVGFEWMKDLDEFFGFEPDLADVREELRKTWNEMSKVEQAETKVAEWTETLSYRMDKYGENSEMTRIAQERLAHWTGILEGEQSDLAYAITTVNDAMLEQQNVAIKLADAEIGYAQATDALASSHKELATAIAEANADGQVTAEEQQRIARAQEGITNQTNATAEAYKRLVMARYEGLEAGELEMYGNAALLLNLEAQREEYGSLPPELEKLRLTLLGNMDAAILATVQMGELALTVKDIPDDKSLVISGDTPQLQLDTLRELGLTVERLPNGDIAVTANTTEAQNILDEFIETERTATITATISWPRGVEERRSRENQDFADQFGIAGPHRARGGAVYGPGGPTADAIPAWLSNGEYVVKAASVQKYGLGLLDMINAGRYAMGGLIEKRKTRDGRARFDTGGIAASWGGNITLSGGNLSPLAGLWAEAIGQINALAGLGALLISQQFGRMRSAAEVQLTMLRSSSRQILSGMNLDINTASKTAIAQQVQGYTIYRRTVELLFTAMRNNVVATTNEMGVTLIRTTRVTTDGVGGLFARMRSSVETSVNYMAGAVGTHFARLPSLTAGPVNVVIDKVLNRGLFAAFNGIVRELGLNKEWTIPNAAGIAIAQTGGGSRLAAGGRVPGYSPHDKADNIPAMLTAGEWVQPVDSVNYYGADFMEAIRKRRIPRDVLQYRATGGEIYAKTLTAFPRAKWNSLYRPGDPGYHGRNQAADMGEAGFSGGIGRAYIAAMKRWWVDNFGNSANEIIYNGAGNDRPNINNGRPFAYSTATQLEHFNHLHVAYAGALAGVTGAPDFSGLSGVAVFVPPAWYSKYGSAAGVFNALRGSVDAVEDIQAGRVGTIYNGLADRAVEYVWSKAKPAVEGLFAGIAGSLQSALAPSSGASGPIVDIVRSVASKYGWGDGNEWNSLSQLLTKESSWNPNAQNPTSTAYGLFQFLNSTWAGVGATKTSDPGLQTEAGLRYIQGRYGSPSKALAFHLQNNWYSEGGEVTAPEGAPTLYDSGGWLPPGISTVLNATNRPEPILTTEQWNELTSGRGGDGGYQTIGELHLHQVKDSLEDAVAEVNHWASVYDKQGGRYAPTGV